MIPTMYPTNIKPVHQVHAKMIHAWADGKPIQFRATQGERWQDMGATPVWDASYEYRIKPDEDAPLLIIYKHVSYTPQGGMCFVDEWPHNVRFVFNQSGQLLSVDLVHGW